MNIQINHSPKPPRRVKRSVTPSYMATTDQIFQEHDDSDTIYSFRKGKRSVDHSSKSPERASSNKSLLVLRHSKDLKSSFSIGTLGDHEENIPDEGMESKPKEVNNLLTSKQKGLLKPIDISTLDSTYNSTLYDRTNSQVSTRRSRACFDSKENVNINIFSSTHKSKHHTDENSPSPHYVKQKKPLPYNFRDPFKSSLDFLS